MGGRGRYRGICMGAGRVADVCPCPDGRMGWALLVVHSSLCARVQAHMPAACLAGRAGRTTCPARSSRRWGQAPLTLRRRQGHTPGPLHRPWLARHRRQGPTPEQRPLATQSRRQGPTLEHPHLGQRPMATQHRHPRSHLHLRQGDSSRSSSRKAWAAAVCASTFILGFYCSTGTFKCTQALGQVQDLHGMPAFIWL